MRIYVAGPYSPQSDYFHTIIQEARQNVDEALTVGIALIELGHKPYVPHLTHFIHTHPDARDYDRWYLEYDNSFLRHWAEGVFMMGKWKGSKGATEEYKLAKDLDLEVFFTLAEVPDNSKTMEEWLSKRGDTNE